jgi:glycosyltransferase involved in cell wall biosynthesis
LLRLPPDLKKIGILLAIDPGRGGMFQYSIAVLEALASLHGRRYSVVAAYFDPAWKAYIDPLGLPSFRIGTSGREPTTIGKLWCSACLPVGLWRALLWRVDSVARALRGADCDLWVFPAQDHWSYLTPVRAVVTIHDLMHRYERRFPEVSGRGRYFIREYRFRNICRAAAAVLVDSEVGRRQVIDSYRMSAGRLFVLPYLPPRYIFEGVPREDFAQCYRLPARFLFYPAQFWPHKNHDRLLQAVARVRRSCPDVALVLAGPKRYEYRKLLARVNELGLSGQVTFTGYVPDEDLAELYRRATALVMPTFFGPTNIPPLEAFATGCAAAVSNIYGMPEQVGDAALLFDPLSVAEIAEAIERLWTDEQLRRTLTGRGRERSVEWGQRQFAAALENVVDGVETTVARRA